MDPEVILNDRWWSADTSPPDDPHVVRSFDDVPKGIVTEPWELSRGVGHSHGFNRNERHEHHLTGFDIVSLLTEVVAKGGHLLLSVGPAGGRHDPGHAGRSARAKPARGSGARRSSSTEPTVDDVGRRRTCATS